MNENVTKRIAQARKVIEQKYKALRTQTNASQTRFQQVYKPLIEPLEKIAAVTSNPSEKLVKKENLNGKEDELSALFSEVLQPNIKKTRGKKRRNREFTILNQSKEKMMRTGSTSESRESDEFDDSEEPDNFENPNPGRSWLRLSNMYLPSSEMSVDQSLGSSMLDASNNRETNDWLNKFVEHMGPVSGGYVRNLFSGDQERDNVFGPYFSQETLKLGSKTLDFDEHDNILIDDKRYPASVGLFQLIFKSYSQLFNNISNSDKQTYKEILEQTNAHRINSSPSQKIKSSPNLKYKFIIADLFPARGRGFGRKTNVRGRGLRRKAMVVTNHPVDYRYYDDPNELVDRLELLVEETNAGHTGHRNEIQEILEELEESGLIINSSY